MQSSASRSWRTVGLLVVGMVLSACGGGSEPPAESGQGTQPAPPVTAAEPGAPAGTAGASGTASVSGTVDFEGSVPRLRPLQMDADPGCLKKHSEPVLPEFLVLGEDNLLANVFVRVKSGLPDGTYAPPAEPVVLDQRGCRYVPHVTGAVVGQKFKILNSDGLLHNVHSLAEKNPQFNRAMPASVAEAEFTFDSEEIMFRIKCDVHPWMNAFVGVVPHPYFAVTGLDGGYSLAGLPAGTYEIEAWHERLGTQTETVSIEDGETVRTDFTFVK